VPQLGSGVPYRAVGVERRERDATGAEGRAASRCGRAVASAGPTKTLKKSCRGAGLGADDIRPRYRRAAARELVWCKPATRRGVSASDNAAYVRGKQSGAGFPPAGRL
jgi:hypothetical protein